MRRRSLNILLDRLLLGAGFVVLSTGFVLLVCFHMGHGAFATTALGLGKLVWLNLHRFAAVILAVAVLTHVWRRRRSFRQKIMNVVTRRTRKGIYSEPLMYGACFVATLTGLVAWLVLAGSSPVFGPAVIGRASADRHPWIDAHHSSALLALVLIVHHVGRRWRAVVGRRRRPAAAPRGR